MTTPTPSASAASPAADELHGRIMNIRADGATLDWANTREAYLYGHRDARHAAAELVSEALAAPPAAAPTDDERKQLIEFFGVSSDEFFEYRSADVLRWRARLVDFLQSVALSPPAAGAEPSLRQALANFCDAMEALEFAARMQSSEWPERCQEIVRRARAALAAAPSLETKE